MHKIELCDALCSFFKVVSISELPLALQLSGFTESVVSLIHAEPVPELESRIQELTATLCEVLGQDEGSHIIETIVDGLLRNMKARETEIVVEVGLDTAERSMPTHVASTASFRVLISLLSVFGADAVNAVLGNRNWRRLVVESLVGAPNVRARANVAFAIDRIAAHSSSAVESAISVLSEFPETMRALLVQSRAQKECNARAELAMAMNGISLLSRIVCVASTASTQQENAARCLVNIFHRSSEAQACDDAAYLLQRFLVFRVHGAQYAACQLIRQLVKLKAGRGKWLAGRFLSCEIEWHIAEGLLNNQGACWGTPVDVDIADRPSSSIKHDLVDLYADLLSNASTEASRGRFGRSFRAILSLMESACGPAPFAESSARAAERDEILVGKCASFLLQYSVRCDIRKVDVADYLRVLEQGNVRMCLAYDRESSAAGSAVASLSGLLLGGWKTLGGAPRYNAAAYARKRSGILHTYLRVVTDYGRLKNAHPSFTAALFKALEAAAIILGKCRGDATMHDLHKCCVGTCILLLQRIKEYSETSCCLASFSMLRSVLRVDEALAASLAQRLLQSRFVFEHLEWMHSFRDQGASHAQSEDESAALASLRLVLLRIIELCQYVCSRAGFRAAAPTQFTTLSIYCKRLESAQTYSTNRFELCISFIAAMSGKLTQEQGCMVYSALSSACGKIALDIRGRHAPEYALLRVLLVGLSNAWMRSAGFDVSKIAASKLRGSLGALLSSCDADELLNAQSLPNGASPETILGFLGSVAAAGYAGDVTRRDRFDAWTGALLRRCIEESRGCDVLISTMLRGLDKSFLQWCAEYAGAHGFLIALRRSFRNCAEVRRAASAQCMFQSVVALISKTAEGSLKLSMSTLLFRKVKVLLSLLCDIEEYNARRGASKIKELLDATPGVLQELLRSLHTILAAIDIAACDSSYDENKGESSSSTPDILTCALNAINMILSEVLCSERADAVIDSCFENVFFSCAAHVEQHLERLPLCNKPDAQSSIAPAACAYYLSLIRIGAAPRPPKPSEYPPKACLASFLLESCMFREDRMPAFISSLHRLLATTLSGSPCCEDAAKGSDHVASVHCLIINAFFDARMSLSVQLPEGSVTSSHELQIKHDLLLYGLTQAVVSNSTLWYAFRPVARILVEDIGHGKVTAASTAFIERYFAVCGEQIPLFKGQGLCVLSKLQTSCASGSRSFGKDAFQVLVVLSWMLVRGQLSNTEIRMLESAVRSAGSVGSAAKVAPSPLLWVNCRSAVVPASALLLARFSKTISTVCSDPAIGVADIAKAPRRSLERYLKSNDRKFIDLLKLLQIALRSFEI